MDNFLDNKFLKDFLEKIKNYDDNINMIFYGIPGCAKTTITRYYLNEIYEKKENYLEINSSDYRGVNLEKSRQYLQKELKEVVKMRERLSKADEPFELQAYTDKTKLKEFKKNCLTGGR